VLVRGAAPSSARVVPPPSSETAGPLSDHAAVVVALAPSVSAAPRWTVSHDAACAIVPPRSAWPAIDAIRARLDPAFGRWPPHVNPAYPFVAPSELAAAERALAVALVDAAPFMVRLDGFGRFERRDGRATVWLAPRAGGEALQSLQRSVEAAVPLPRERPVTHHLTVATCRRDEAAALERAGAPEIAPFVVDEVVLLARQAGRMRARATVPLGGGVGLAEALAETGLLPDERRAAAIARAAALVEEAAREAGGGAIVPIGSEALGVALAGSDVDLVWDSTGPLEALAEALARRGVRARVVDGAFSRVLRALVAIPTGTAGSTIDLPIDVLVGDEGARVALGDVAALRARATPRFVAALRAVRVWAARRALVGAAACMPSSLAWAVLVADACAAIPDGGDDGAQVAAVFRALGAWRPGPVPTPAPPPRDAARALTPSTAEALSAELARAAALVSGPRVPWRALFAPVPIGGGLPTVAALQLGDGDADAARGRVAGRMRGVVERLAEQGIRARPDPRPLILAGRAVFAIGLATLEGGAVDPEEARPALERAGRVTFVLDD
jgi:2'-5' RNA ligase